MNTRISPRERDVLSAYLDGQLSSRQQAQIESRLQASPELRHALEELSQARSLLRSAPRQRAPRNFTLTPEMAGLRPGVRSLPGAYPVLRLASALAALFFVVIFAGELVFGSMQSEPMFVAQAPQLSAPVMGMGGGGGGGDEESPEASVEMPAEAPAAEGEAAATEEMLAKAYEPMDAAGAPPLEVTPLGQQAETPAPDEGANALERSVLPAAPEQDMAHEAQVETTPLPDEAETGAPAWPVLRLLQILLALLAVGCGLGAIYLRRSARA
ncbi:MAG: hypothetical protein JXA78_03950 [Anaerolineales bacterium]|nr:hypothetical protein [Anaerolineales bacterium]